MSDSANPAERLEPRNPLRKWVEEAQKIIDMVRTLLEDNERQRALAEAAQRQEEKLRDEVARLRVENERHRTAAEAAERQRQELYGEIRRLQVENERLVREQTEAGDAAAKLLDEIRQLLSNVTRRIQTPPRSSPFGQHPYGRNP